MPNRILVRLCLTAIFAAIVLFAGAVTITVKDPSGAVVADASVVLRDAAGTIVTRGVTDRAGRVAFPSIPAGSYTLIVERAGFSTEQRTAAVGDGELAVDVALKIEQVETSVEVADKLSSLANSDPNYKMLRAGQPASAYRVENLVLERDLGKITFRSGTVEFLPPAAGRVVMGVFTGSGNFELTPKFIVERKQLERLTGAETISEEIESAVLCFTDSSYEQIVKKSQPLERAARGGEALAEFRARMRRRFDQPRSSLEALLTGEGIANVEADLLADLYDTSAPKSFSAYFHGRKHKDLRFLIRPRGALPQMMSPEEVAVVNYDPLGDSDAIWYLTHLEEEWKAGTVSSSEDKRVVAAEHYAIETVIGKNDKIAAVCALRAKGLVAGPRVLRFSLLPNLRVSRVTLDGKDISFIQQGKKEDGSLYAVLPSPIEKGRVYQLGFEYGGNKVLEKAGSSTFYVKAREAWYPNATVFAEHSTFDLTFKIPKKYNLVGVGQLVEESKENDFVVSKWVSKTPIAVAGFNYGLFKQRKKTDDTAHYDVETYVSGDAPDYLAGAGAANFLTPTSMAANAMAEAQNSIRLFQQYFGPLPYGRVAITQQPDFFFGQSWPTLIYLPVSAFLDATRRWQLLGQHAFKFADFIDVVGPHEVAHQWWGHVVGWASYHDQWLSEGFAHFSAGLYLRFTEDKPDKYHKFWEDQRKIILDKNGFGVSGNDAGPVWLGLRLISFKNPHAYQKVVYSKGGYVLHMLHQLMRDDKGSDAPFIAMMKEFVQDNFNANASTEDFRAVVNKHMPASLDLEGNHRMDWFFREWVYSTEIPRYRLEYKLEESGGNWTVRGALTQSGVSDNFLMRVPFYAEIDGRTIRVGTLFARGSTTGKEFQVKLPKKPKRVFLNANHDVLAAEAISKEL